jgi:hypothetical protein
MLDLKRTGAGRKLLHQVLSHNESKEKHWSKQQQLQTQKSHKNCNSLQTTSTTHSSPKTQ